MPRIVGQESASPNHRSKYGRNGVKWKDREAELKPLLMSAHVAWPEYEHDLVYTQLGFQL